VITPPQPPAPIIIFVPAPVVAPAPVFAPTPASPPAAVLIPAPIADNEKRVEKPEIKNGESVTAQVITPAVPISETVTPPVEVAAQKVEKIEIKKVEATPEITADKVLTKIAVPKLPAFKGVGPFKFSLGLSDQESAAPIKDPDLAIGLKVFSQTPMVCKVAVTFNKSTSKYSVSVVGLTNGLCRISAFDRGSDEKFPTATEIKQTISGIEVKRNVTTKAVKPTPAPKIGVKNASYTKSKN
jgi:hypothetical protein